MHIHAESSEGEAKFWLYPEVTAAKSAGYNRKQLSQLTKVIADHRDEIEKPGMNTSVRAKSLTFDEYTMWVELDDGRSLGGPLV